MKRTDNCRTALKMRAFDIIERAFAGLIIFIMLAMGAFTMRAYASDEIIDVSTAKDGYFTVFYDSSEAGSKMKVGVSNGSDIRYYCYVPGQSSAYSFIDWDSTYTITLYASVSGNNYRQVASKSVEVDLSDPMAPYLVSTECVTFNEGDEVSLTASGLCGSLTNDADRVTAIYRYIASGFTYNNTLGEQARQGTVVNYVPDTEYTFDCRSGICYDLSALLAAMCRSQDIPCVIVKGYLNGEYHAWNMVYVNDVWNALDVTRAVLDDDKDIRAFSDCIAPADGYTPPYSFE